MRVQCDLQSRVVITEGHQVENVLMTNLKGLLEITGS